MLLVLVCWFGLYFDCMYLVNNGVDFNCSNENGIIFLIVVIMSRNYEIVIFLFGKNV